MELIPFLIFAVIAFNIFKGFSKSASSNSKSSDLDESPKDLMRRLHQQMERTQKSNPGHSGERNKTPTQRGRESLARKGQGSPWNHKHDLGGDKSNLSPRAQAAAKILKTQVKSARIASHKNIEQHGRRGKNMDQNRHRTDEWGAKGDSGLLSGKSLVFLLVLVGVGLYVLSQMPVN